MKKIILNWKNIILVLLNIIFIITLTISIYKIINWKIYSDKTKTEITTLQENIHVEEVRDTKNTEIIEQPEKIPKENPYWDYINMNMINVGFNKSYNTAGWVFLDYRNNSTNNQNTIIYAHGRTDKTMFGALRNILNNNWLNNPNNYIIKISTEKENSLWQIFSAYHLPTTNDYLQTTFSGDTEYQIFLEMLKNRSSFNFNTNVSSNDNILTLSTCYNNSDKMVVHAKLIKKENK